MPIGLAGSLGLAMLLNRGVRGTNIFRTVFFLPTLTPAVALAVLWLWLLQPEVGPINYALSLVGITGPAWLSSKDWALPSIMIINLWASWGGNAMLIFLAGLQGVPQELLRGGRDRRRRRLGQVPPRHAADDLADDLLQPGARRHRRAARSSRSPSSRPRAGRPTRPGSSRCTSTSNAFEYFKMGYGSALAWIFVVILLVFTYFQLGLSRRWVYYAAEEDSDGCHAGTRRVEATPAGSTRVGRGPPGAHVGSRSTSL